MRTRPDSTPAKSAPTGARATRRIYVPDTLWTEAGSTSGQVRIPVGGAAGSVTTLGGATGRAGETVGSSTKRHRTSPVAVKFSRTADPWVQKTQSASVTQPSQARGGGLSGSQSAILT